MNMMKKLGGVVMVAGLAVAFAPQSQAATKVSSFPVTANVLATCDIVTTGVAFGTYDSTALDGLGTGTVVATCSLGAPYTVTMGGGLLPDAANPIGGAAARRMGGTAPTNTGDRLAYQLYQPDAANARTTTVWTATAGVAGTGNGAAQTLNIFGTLPTGQAAARQGAYSDTVVATITY